MASPTLLASPTLSSFTSIPATASFPTITSAETETATSLQQVNSLFELSGAAGAVFYCGFLFSLLCVLITVVRVVLNWKTKIIGLVDHLMIAGTVGHFSSFIPIILIA